MIQVKVEEILFLDIETASICSNYTDLDDADRKHWAHKASFIQKSEEVDPSSCYDRAAIYAEFGKVVCICVGMVSEKQEGARYMKLRSFYDGDEQKLLSEFAGFLSKMKSQVVLCAHNGKEFDFPYLCRRMLINQIALPTCLQIAGKKPWEIKHLDTLELWKFGDYKHYTSLDLLAHVFRIESPKSQMSGDRVSEYYHHYQDHDAIIEYCYQDVITIAQLLLRFNQEELLQPKNIYYV